MTDTPRDCWTCRNRKEIETCAMSAFVSKPENVCREFGRSEGTVSSGIKHSLLPCGYAYDTFCGGAAYKPDFWMRVVNLFVRK